MIHIKDTQKVLGTLLNQIPRGHLIAAGSLLASLLITVAITPNDEPVPTEDVTAIMDAAPVDADDSSFDAVISPLKIPELADNKAAESAFALPKIDAMLTTTGTSITEQVADKPSWRELAVKTGDNLSSIFGRAGLNDRDIYELFDGTKSAKELKSLAPGQKMAFLLDEQGKLQELKYFKNSLDSLNFTRNNTGFTSQKISLKPEVRQAFREGTINSSLFMAGKQAGIPNNLTMELANIFGFDIDFALDIQKGDSFKVIYEEQFLEGKRIGIGDILSAEFTNEGKTYRAVRYTNKEGVTRYYSADGKGLNKAFLRTPVDFARISSSFSLGRLHPILNTIRAHKGTDYAAATGTPIRATGDGKVIFAGRQGGYGNLIVIQHGQGFETRYGHMNSFAKGITTGSRVSQGQIIGTVGMTGLASGPHLHYEFHMNGQVRDPVTVPLPQSMGVATNEKDRFMAATQTLVAQLDTASRMAMGESKTKSN